MLISIQIPFIDARRFLPHVPQPLPTPGWPAPFENEFVRFFGSIKPRKAFDDWIPEPYYCNAAKALKFVKGPKSIIANMSLISRRLFFDGRASGKLEVVFLSRAKGRWNSIDLSSKELVETLQESQIRLITFNENRKDLITTKLGSIQKHFPLQWAISTTATSEFHNLDKAKNWIVAGPMTIMVSSYGNHRLLLPRGSMAWLRQKDHKSRPVSTSIYFSKPSSLWNINTSGTNASRNYERCLRISLLRLNSEFFGLRNILKFLSYPQYRRQLRGVGSMVNPPEFSHLGHHLINKNGTGRFR